jgi:hypothetical protein
VGAKQFDFVAEQTTQWNRETQLLQFLEDDLQYFPLVAALSKGKFSEFQTKDEAGSKLISFPFCSVAPISIMVAVFGENGWIYSRGLIYSIYFLSFFGLVYFLTDQFILAVAIGLLNFLTQFNTSGFLLKWAERHHFLISLSYQDRIPRPLVTDMYAWLLLGAVVLLIKNTLRNEKTLAAWLGVLVFLCLLIQGDIYTSFTFVLVLGALVAVRVLTVKLRQLPLLTAAGILLISPFVFQLVASSPDIRARLGVEIVPRLVFFSRITESPGHYFRLFLASIGFLFILKLLERWNWITRFDFHILLFVTALVVISRCAMDLFGLIMGRMIQGYHFEIAANFFVYVFLFISSTILLTKVFRTPFKTQVFAVILLAFSFAGYYYSAVLPGRMTQKFINTHNLRSDFKLYSGLGTHYQDDFAKLTDFLNGSIGNGPHRGLVLSTFDNQLASWWVTFKGQYLFLPDVVLSTLPQSAIEGRFGYNCYLLGLGPDECVGLLTTTDGNDHSYTNYAILYFFLGHDLYHTNMYHSLSPEASYSAEQIARMRGTSLESTWNLQVPQSETARLSAVFAEARGGYQSPDYFVLFNTGRIGWLARRFEDSHSAKNYCKVFETPTFLVFENNASLSRCCCNEQTSMSRRRITGGAISPAIVNLTGLHGRAGR